MTKSDKSAGATDTTKSADDSAMQGKQDLMFDQVLPTDGRDLDRGVADVSGAGSGQRANPERPNRPMPGAGAPVWNADPAAGPSDTYYDQPVVKAPPWGGRVAAYIVAGGIAGSAAALGAASVLAGGSRVRGVSRVAMPLAAVTGGVGTVLLLSDLGRPLRALHMFRVVRPTSVMNVGGYLLAGTVGAASVATAADVLASVVKSGPTHGVAVGTQRLSSVAAGLIGIPLSGYTGVLLASTAIPGWNIGEVTLPPLFMASGAATSGSLLRLLPLDPPQRAAVDVFTTTAQIAELAAERAHERLLHDRPRIRASYDSVPAWRLGKLLTAASLVIGVSPLRRTRVGRLVGSAAGVVGSTMTKVAVFEAGMRTAADPHAVGEGPTEVGGWS